jgi:hypothetical protein
VKWPAESKALATTPTRARDSLALVGVVVRCRRTDNWREIDGIAIAAVSIGFVERKIIRLRGLVEQTGLIETHLQFS